MSFQRYNPRYRLAQHFTSFESDPIIIERIKKLLLPQDSPLELREQELLRDFYNYWERHGGRITTSQYKVFCQIEQKYSPEQLSKEESFRKQWNEDSKIQENFRICCAYYKKEGYYSSIVEKLEGVSPRYIPTQIKYEKICCNKYSKRLLDSLRDPPKFNVGDLVQVCGSSVYSFASIGLIISNNGLPSRAVKNGKIYKIQCLKTGKQFETEEKYIRKLRVKKEKKNEAC